MRRFNGIALGALLLASACKVERTPAKYFDHKDPIEVERQAAVSEVQDRLLAMTRALDRGNAAEALIALSPAADAYLIGPDEGVVVSGADQVGALLTSLLEGPVPAQLRDVQVGVGPRANIAWFRAFLEVPGHTPDGTRMRMTGVYVRDAGLWKLVQAHLSLPVNPTTPSPSSPSAPAADSAGAE